MPNSVFEQFVRYLSDHDMWPKPIKQFPMFRIDIYGNVYRSDGSLVKIYHYEGQYDSVYLKDGHRYKKYDIHVLVAQAFSKNYYAGCVVHHKDENKYNNCISNLEILDKREHARHHANPQNLINWAKNNPHSNKGKKMSDAQKRLLSELVKKRWASGVYDKKRQARQFYGNQYVDRFGNKKHPK